MALIAVQTIAGDQTEVATKTQDLLETYSVDADNFSHITMVSFGESQFQITVVYDG